MYGNALIIISSFHSIFLLCKNGTNNTIINNIYIHVLRTPNNNEEPADIPTAQSNSRSEDDLQVIDLD